MQTVFDFGAGGDMAWMRDALRARFGRPSPFPRRTPIGQMVKSLISGRTRDAVSLAAYERLVATYENWSVLAAAPVGTVEAAIADVTFPENKAQRFGRALRAVAADHPDYDLAFLKDISVGRALGWLEKLPGVGRKVSASTLNFSTLNMPAFVIDTHVKRILRRFGFVGGKADTGAAYGAAMAIMPDWSAGDLAELHILAKALGQSLCRADRASCEECPIRARCKTASAGQRVPKANFRQPA